MAAVKFSPSEDEELIDSVASLEILWNVGDAEFKNTLKKEVIWERIGKKLNKSGGQCKVRWRSIRDHYKRQKKQEKEVGTESATVKRRASYWDRLMFLDEVSDEREGISNILPKYENNTTQEITTNESSKNPANQQESYCDSLLENPCHNSNAQNKRNQSHLVPNSRMVKIKKNKPTKELVDIFKEREDERIQIASYLNKINEQVKEDETDLFFKSMALTVKKFDPDIARETKTKIFHIVMDMEAVNQRSRNVANFDYGSSSYSSPSSSHCPTP